MLMRFFQTVREFLSLNVAPHNCSCSRFLFVPLLIWQLSLTYRRAVLVRVAFLCYGYLAPVAVAAIAACDPLTV